MTPEDAQRFFAEPFKRHGGDCTPYEGDDELVVFLAADFWRFCAEIGRRQVARPELKPERNAELRRLRAQGWTLAALEERFDLSRRRVQNILDPDRHRERRRAADARRKARRGYP